MERNSRPLVVAFDGSSEARAAVRAASDLMPGRRLLVTTVWEPSLIAPPQSLGMPYARPDSEEIEAFERAEHDDAATTAEVRARGSERPLRALRRARDRRGGARGCACPLSRASSTRTLVSYDVAVSERVVVAVNAFEALPQGDSGSRRALVRWSDGSTGEALRWYDDEVLFCEGDHGHRRLMPPAD